MLICLAPRRSTHVSSFLLDQSCMRPEVVPERCDPGSPRLQPEVWHERTTTHVQPFQLGGAVSPCTPSDQLRATPRRLGRRLGDTFGSVWRVAEKPRVAPNFEPDGGLQRGLASAELRAHLLPPSAVIALETQVFVVWLGLGRVRVPRHRGPSIYHYMPAWAMRHGPWVPRADEYVL